MASLWGDRNRRKATVKYAKSAKNIWRIAIPMLYHNVLGNMSCFLRSKSIYSITQLVHHPFSYVIPSQVSSPSDKGKEFNINFFVLFFVNTFDLRPSWKYFGSSALNPGAVFLRFFTVAFLLFRTPAGALTLRGQLSNPAGQSLTFN